MPYTYHIEHDESCPSPRENDNLGTIAAWHRRHTLHDDHCQPKGPEGFTRWLAEMTGTAWGDTSDAVCRRIADREYIVLPVYLFDHSGLALSTSPFGDPWDSGQVGYIFCSKADARNEWGVKRLSKKREMQVIDQLKAEINEYSQWLGGDCWGYMIDSVSPDDPEEVIAEGIDACWGFIGREYCEEEAQRLVNHMNQDEKGDAHVHHA